MTDRNHIPYESCEYLEQEQWSEKLRQRALEVVPCIAGWFDICGYGSVLAGVKWDLTSLRDTGLFDALGRAYSLLGSPLIAGVPPMPTERVLIMNDGVARTTDLTPHADHAALLFYIRDLLMRHHWLQVAMTNQGLGLRSVLAGGERCQYSPVAVTGESILHYTGEPSAHGKKLLQQQFVYHPAEFQMNTAFAMAYTIEALGSAHGVTPNHLYIADTWIQKISAVMPRPVTVTPGAIEIPWADGLGISILFDEQRSIVAKGFATELYRVCELVMHPEFDGEETRLRMT